MIPNLAEVQSISLTSAGRERTVELAALNVLDENTSAQTEGTAVPPTPAPTRTPNPQQIPGADNQPHPQSDSTACHKAI